MKMTPVSSQHFSCCSVLNPAALCLAPAYGDRHDCPSVTEQPLAPLHDISDVPLQKPDIILFVDASCPRGSTGHPASGCAVCTSTKGLEAYSLSTVSSVQIAELAVLDLHLCTCTRAISSPEQSVFTLMPDTPLGLGTTVGNFENNSAS